jgi:hypothetical protein
MENNNVFLYEDGKKIDFLTKPWNIDFWNVAGCDTDKEKIAYKILQASGKFGIVQKVRNSCGWSMKKTYYAIRLDGNTDTLTEAYSEDYTTNENVKIEGDTLVIKNSDDVVENENQEEMGSIAKSTLIKNWYKQQWKEWVKIIDLNTVSSLTAANTPIAPTPQIQTQPTSLNGTYLYKWSSEEYSIIVKNATEKSFQVKMEASNSDNKVGMADGVFNKQSDGTWFMKLSGDGTSDSPDCQKSSIRLKISNDNFTIQSVDTSWECWSGMTPIIKATYKKQ